MGLLPPLPPVEGFHPLVVHFPIALLAIVPVLFTIAMFAKERAVWARCAALVLAMGTLGVFAAAWSGEAGEDAAERVAAASTTLEAHEEGAEVVRVVFGGLALAYVAFLGLARFLPLRTGPWRVAHVVAIGASVVGLLLLARVAHEGGRLVHEFGVHAPLGASAGSAGPLAPPTSGGSARFDDD